MYRTVAARSAARTGASSRRDQINFAMSSRTISRDHKNMSNSGPRVDASYHQFSPITYLYMPWNASTASRVSARLRFALYCDGRLPL